MADVLWVRNVVVIEVANHSAKVQTEYGPWHQTATRLQTLYPPLMS